MNEQSDLSEAGKGVSRRRFMGLALAGSTMATVAGVLTPIISFLWPPARETGYGGERVLAGTLADVPLNSGKVISVDNKPVIVVNSENGGIKAFSAVCTHLGCIVYWHEQRGVIQCPYHDGRFNPLNGQVILGPLAEYRVQVDGGEVYVGAIQSG